MTRHLVHRPQVHRPPVHHGSQSSGSDRHNVNVMRVSAVINCEEPSPAHAWEHSRRPASDGYVQLSRLPSFDHAAIGPVDNHRAVHPLITPDSPPTRASRPDYNEEQELFIWYHRTDLKLPWDEVMRAFNQYFRANHSNPRAKGGLQCKMYRVLDKHGVPKVRQQARSQRENPDCIGQFNMAQRSVHRFRWMRAEDRRMRPQSLPVRVAPQRPVASPSGGHHL